MESFIDRIRAWLARNRIARLCVIVVLIVLSAFEIDAIVRGLRDPYLADDLSLQYEHGRLIRERDIVTPEEIEPWMTFQYVNFIFGLPDAYLKNSLALSEERYPKIQIAGYARRAGLSTEEFLATVKDAVAAYSQ